MCKFYEEIRKEKTQYTEEIIEEFIRVFKEKNLDTKEKLIEYVKNDPASFGDYDESSIVFVFAKDIKLNIYEKLREHKIDSNSEFIEEVIEQLILSNVFKEEDLESISNMNFTYGDKVLNKLERLNVIEGHVCHYSNYDGKTLDELLFLGSKEKILKNSKVYEERIIAAIELLYYLGFDLLVFDEIYRLILEDKLQVMRKYEE